MSINRNKQSICIDFHKERGRQLIVDLAKKSDVLLENYLPGKLDEIGLGYEQLREVNPRLIYCSYVACVLPCMHVIVATIAITPHRCDAWRAV